jgi:hypothetical protein
MKRWATLSRRYARAVLEILDAVAAGTYYVDASDERDRSQPWWRGSEDAAHINPVFWE